MHIARYSAAFLGALLVLSVAACGGSGDKSTAPDFSASDLNGGGGMPPFKGQLSTKQVNDVAAYVTEKIAK